MRGAAAALALATIAARAWALSGAEIYAQACAACHGADGRGAPGGSRITVPLPDFTDCTVSTAETTANWAGLVRHGGPFLGLSDQMPAFGDALGDAEIAAVVAYLRGFCAEPRYPIGDLNYRRPVFVEKAFPEDEAVLNGEIESSRHARGYTSELELETRVGPRGQIAASLPAGAVDPNGAPLRAGVGDLALSYRHVLLAAPRQASLVSAGVELGLATGNRRHGLGAGTTVVAPQLLSGHALGPLVVQTQVRAELPADPARADRRMLYRVALQLPLGPYKKCPCRRSSSSSRTPSTPPRTPPRSSPRPSTSRSAAAATSRSAPASRSRSRARGRSTGGSARSSSGSTATGPSGRGERRARELTSRGAAGMRARS